MRNVSVISLQQKWMKEQRKMLRQQRKMLKATTRFLQKTKRSKTSPKPKSASLKPKPKSPARPAPPPPPPPPPPGPRPPPAPARPPPPQRKLPSSKNTTFARQLVVKEIKAHALLRNDKYKNAVKNITQLQLKKLRKALAKRMIETGTNQLSSANVTKVIQSMKKH